MMHRLYTYIYIVCLTLGIALPNAAGAQITVEARLDSTNILIGQQVMLRAKVKAAKGSRVDFRHFAPGDTLTRGVEVIASGEPDTVYEDGGKRMVLTKPYAITSFDSALYRLPPVEVTVDGKTYRSATPLALKVNTVRVDTTHTDQYTGPHAPVAPPFEWNARLLGESAAMLLLLVAVIWLAVRLSDSRPLVRRVVIYPPAPPHETALTDITRLKDAKEEAKAYYMKLTDTLRTYLQGRYGFNAREMTTGEILDALHGLQDDEQARAELQEILGTADLVKFARYEVGLSEQERSLMQAVNFVNETKLVPAEKPQPKIVYEEVDGSRQNMIRHCLTAALTLCTAALLAATAYTLYDFYNCFL